ncbi:hypothetical protein vBYenM636_62 [Yersinia phage vB_YenM_636]|nr:hypothetical protein vBYenM12_62 [Yersinia phage vB_YenM_12]QKN86404.1 hypothetical protein vBYenM22_62 [Yersinia phage vB_YenM_22]QKN86495.1 hypothetical protein vBYenM25_62 [Yersinia phage vB_YenM_25]QKN86586.1 hypothetical protein vBYenM27_62 [Yersinia phage vB_YenM_27]QKN86677.1 hypothetical protein vBYenM39_62 [Yersinia phage vB_YenM_39]QKN86768.1 hypothetical protein vBYenM126_62 [Yersinia phage vB_YenM_126]QKN86859.1 hypothetical protein vBYenM526-1_62 [Yersinia phage vB_YenM_526-1]
MMLFDLDEVFEDLMRTFTAYRVLGGFKDDEGNWVDGFAEELDFDATPPQPLSGDDLKQFKEGEDVSAIKYIYTTYQLRVRKGEKPADKVVMGDIEYLVYKIDEHSTLSEFRKVYLQRIEGQQ